MNWFPDWSDGPTVIVASGASARLCDLAQVRGRAHVIAVNDSWKLVPWADALYACDAKWWRVNGPSLTFEGLRISIDARRGYGSLPVKVKMGERQFLFGVPGEIGDGHNGGFHAINLAAQFGAKRIALVGLDFTGGHWHGQHKLGMNNPTDENFNRWRKIMEWSAPALIERGIEVTNCSAISTIDCFPRARLSEFLSETSDVRLPIL